MTITAISRDWGVSPSIVRITTTDDLSTITTAGYLLTQIEAIEAIQHGEFEWVDGDMVSIDYSDGEGIFTRDVDNDAFVAIGGGGGDFGTMALQDSDNVNITGGSIDGVSISGISGNLLPLDTNSYSIGSTTLKWNILFVNDIRNGLTPGDTTIMSARDTGNGFYVPFIKATAGAPPKLELGAQDIDGAVFVPFMTWTSGNTPTCDLADGVTAFTQDAADDSTKVATTAFVQAAIAAALA